MKMKKSLNLVLAMILTVSLLAGSSAGNVQITFSHNQPLGGPEDIGAEAFRARLIELAGADRVTVNIFPANQLGQPREQIESTQMGVINISLQPVASLTPFADDIKLIDLPYILPRDRDRIFEVLGGPIGKEALSPLSASGFQGLGYWFGGFKLFTTRNTEIRVPDDFIGLRIRVMDSPLLISQFTAWGATAVPIAFGELYNALAQNVVDGQENPVQTIVQQNFHEVQNYIIQSYHGAMTYVLIANKGWFDSLDADMQGWILEAEAYGRQAMRVAYEAREQDFLEIIKNAPNVTLYALTDEQIYMFRMASRPVYEEHASTEWQRQMVAKFQEAFGTGF